MKSLIRYCAYGLFVAGGIALGYTLLIWLYAEGFQLYGNWRLDRSLRKSESVAPDQSLRTQPELHSVIGRIEIPSLDLSTVVVEGVEERDLLLGAGHIPGTALPGEEGNTVISAHRDTFFRPLRNIRKNDVIIVTTLDGSYQYVVESMWVTGPEDISVLGPESRPVLKLITCHPFSYIGPAPERFVVLARRLTVPVHYSAGQLNRRDR